MNDKQNFDIPQIPRITSAIADWVKTEFIKEKRIISHNGTEYEYLILDGEEVSKIGGPRIFAICMNGMFAVSDLHPKEYADQAMSHELVENIDNIDIKDTDETICVHCLQNELEEVRKDSSVEYNDYVIARQKFFEDLVRYYTNKKRAPIEDFLLKKVSLSLDFLNAHVVELQIQT